MKTKLNITLAAMAALMGSAFAGTPVKTVVVSEPDFYRAGEFQGSVSFLGAAQNGGRRNGGAALGGLAQPNGLAQPGGPGGGRPAWTTRAAAGVDAELRYFITRNIGVGVEGQWLSTPGGLYGSALNLYYRMPLSQGSRWAPYVFGGAGGLYASNRAFFEGHVGGGLEYRITEKLGVFTDARYEWVEGGRNNVPQFGAMRLGLNVVF